MQVHSNGAWFVQENTLSDNSKVYDIYFWAASDSEARLIYGATDRADAIDRCDRLFAATA